MRNRDEDRIYESFTCALNAAARNSAPYRHWILADVFPQDIVQDLQTLEFPLQELKGVSGKRELHNDSRHYFDRDNIATYPVVAAVANAFQAPRMARFIQDFFDADLEGTLLRLEYAQDTSGFWLQPHTDLGVKRLTVLIYLSDGPDHETLGTDIYADDKAWTARSPFSPGTAMAFVPGANTYHGFEPRPIEGVRKSLILNYVTTEWRDREQLSFPENTVSAQ